MFDYRFTVAAQLSHREPLVYSVVPRTVPTLVSQFTNPRPHEQGAVRATLPSVISTATGERTWHRALKATQ